MSDEESDLELLELLRQSLGLDHGAAAGLAETGVLESAEYVYDNSVDVAIDMQGTKAAAATIWRLMQEKDYSCKTWSQHQLHPKSKDENSVNLIFIMDLLNFSFWSDCTNSKNAFSIEYVGKRWTGYWSLVAALQRALEEGLYLSHDNKFWAYLLLDIGIPVTSSEYWASQCHDCTSETFRNIFRSATSEEMPLLADRISCIREAGQILIDVSTIPDNVG